MMLLTIIMTMVMITIISAMMIITKYSLPTIDFATRYSTRYSDFFLQPYSNPTRSQKSLLVGACTWHMACDMWHVTQFMTSHAILVIIWHVQQWQIYYQQCTEAISAHHNMDMVTGWRPTCHTWHVTCDKSPKRLVTWSQPFYDPLKQKNNPKNKEYSTFERGGFWSPPAPD